MEPENDACRRSISRSVDVRQRQRTTSAAAQPYNPTTSLSVMYIPKRHLHKIASKHHRDSALLRSTLEYEHLDRETTEQRPISKKQRKKEKRRETKKAGFP